MSQGLRPGSMPCNILIRQDQDAVRVQRGNGKDVFLSPAD